MNRPVELLRGPVASIRKRLSAIAHQSERTILLGTILLGSAVSGAIGFILSQYYSIDVASSLLYQPYDCWLDWGMNVGRHCFSDYGLAIGMEMRPNPWAPYPVLYLPDHQPVLNIYPAAALVPHAPFGLMGEWLGSPRLGLLGYLLALTIALLTPAIWAARGARGLERVVVFVACGAAAIPVWAAIDRGNSVGFIAPIALVFLVALCRHRWGLVTLMVVLAALVKPQFVVLAVALFAARQWRLGGIAVGGFVISNVAAYALWPRDFPATIVQSIRNTFTPLPFQGLASIYNSSFGKGFLTIPDYITLLKHGKIPDGFLAGPRSLLGYAVLVLVVASVLALGRRIPPVMVGIALLATASLFPPLSYRHYLVFVLPIAALVARDPDGSPGSGIFDRLRTLEPLGARRRAVGVYVTLAAALTIVQIPLPSRSYREVMMPGQLGGPGSGGVSVPVVPSSVVYVPPSIVWLVVCAAIIVSYARRPVCSASADASTASASGEPTSAAASEP